MRAVKVKNDKGDADALYIEDGIPDPEPKGDEVLVRIKAFGLNRMDIMQREGQYPNFPKPESWDRFLGVELSGHVEKLGPECSGDFKPGDRVFSLVYGGAYAEKKCVKEKMLVHMPGGMSFEECAGAPETIFTSLQAVHLLGDLKKGESILVHAGASGVGQSAIGLAKVAGASKIFTTAGTDEKCRMCESIGAHFAINYKTTDFAEVIEKETDGKGVDVIIDLVGKDYWDRHVKIAATDARISLVALLSGTTVDNFNLRDLMSKRIWLMGTALRTRSVEYQVNLRNYFVKNTLPHLADGSMKVVVDKVYPWEQVSEAHKRMEANANAGKIICTID